MSNVDDIGDPAFGDDPLTAVPEGTFSAGETGEAVDADGAAADAGLGEVIVGEIPDAHDLAHMLWTARCTVPAHGLLGTFETREMAEEAKRAHLLLVHGRDQSR
jgi:hypothetical protein